MSESKLISANYFELLKLPAELIGVILNQLSDIALINFSAKANLLSKDSANKHIQKVIIECYGARDSEQINQKLISYLRSNLMIPKESLLQANRSLCQQTISRQYFNNSTNLSLLLNFEVNQSPLSLRDKIKYKIAGIHPRLLGDAVLALARNKGLELKAFILSISKEMQANPNKMIAINQSKLIVFCNLLTICYSLFSSDEIKNLLAKNIIPVVKDQNYYPGKEEAEMCLRTILPKLKGEHALPIFSDYIHIILEPFQIKQPLNWKNDKKINENIEWARSVIKNFSSAQAFSFFTTNIQPYFIVESHLSDILTYFNADSSLEFWWILIKCISEKLLADDKAVLGKFIATAASAQPFNQSLESGGRDHRLKRILLLAPFISFNELVDLLKNSNVLEHFFNICQKGDTFNILCELLMVIPYMAEQFFLKDNIEPLLFPNDVWYRDDQAIRTSLEYFAYVWMVSAFKKNPCLDIAYFPNFQKKIFAQLNCKVIQGGGILIREAANVLLQKLPENAALAFFEEYQDKFLHEAVRILAILETNENILKFLKKNSNQMCQRTIEDKVLVFNLLRYLAHVDNSEFPDLNRLICGLLSMISCYTYDSLKRFSNDTGGLFSANILMIFKNIESFENPQAIGDQSIADAFFQCKPSLEVHLLVLGGILNFYNAVIPAPLVSFQINLFKNLLPVDAIQFFENKIAASLGVFAESQISSGLSGITWIYLLHCKKENRAPVAIPKGALFLGTLAASFKDVWKNIREYVGLLTVEEKKNFIFQWIELLSRSIQLSRLANQSEIFKIFFDVFDDKEEPFFLSDLEQIYLQLLNSIFVKLTDCSVKENLNFVSRLIEESPSLAAAPVAEGEKTPDPDVKQKVPFFFNKPQSFFDKFDKILQDYKDKKVFVLFKAHHFILVNNILKFLNYMTDKSCDLDIKATLARILMHALIGFLKKNTDSKALLSAVGKLKADDNLNEFQSVFGNIIAETETYLKECETILLEENPAWFAKIESLLIGRLKEYQKESQKSYSC
jgi:hypothetical protein